MEASSGFSRRSVRRRALLLMLAAMLLMPSKISAQGRFILGVESNSGNFWSGTLLGLPTTFINGMIQAFLGYDEEEIGGGSAYTFRFNRIKMNGQKMDYDGNLFFGFKAKDLFRDFEYSLKLGWQPEQIPVGFYARIGYRHENFQTRMSEADEWTKHRLNCLRPGICIRISPLENMIGNYGFCPIVDIGSNYDYYLSYKGRYGNDKSQLNNGVSTFIGIGLKDGNGNALMLTYDRQNYNLFNKDFTIDGVKPYEDTQTKHFNFALSLSLGL